MAVGIVVWKIKSDRVHLQKKHASLKNDVIKVSKTRKEIELESHHAS